MCGFYAVGMSVVADEQSVWTTMLEERREMVSVLSVRGAR